MHSVARDFNLVECVGVSVWKVTECVELDGNFLHLKKLRVAFTYSRNH